MSGKLRRFKGWPLAASALVLLLAACPERRGAAAPGGAGAPTTSQAAASPLAPDGNALYRDLCASCHQPNGFGVPGAFPPLGRNVLELGATPEGRAYLIATVLYGVQGPLEVQGASYNGIMPGFPHLSDDEVAALFGHVLVVLNDPLGAELEPLSPGEVAAERQTPRSAAEVASQRPSP